MTDALTARTDEIRIRLCYHFLEELGVAVATPSKSAWQSVEVDGPHRFGWMPPMTVDDSDDLFVVTFSPHLIAEITFDLDDEDLDTYLTMTEAFIDASLARPDLNTTEVIAMVEHDLYETEPATLELLSRVQAGALDKGIAR